MARKFGIEVVASAFTDHHAVYTKLWTHPSRGEVEADGR